MYPNINFMANKNNSNHKLQKKQLKILVALSFAQRFYSIQLYVFIVYSNKMYTLFDNILSSKQDFN